MTDDKDITPAMLLQHLGKKMDDMEKRMNKRFDGIDANLRTLQNNVHLLFAQTKNLSDELDNVEIVQLPKMRKSIRNLSKRLSDHTALPSHQPALKA